MRLTLSVYIHSSSVTYHALRVLVTVSHHQLHVMPFMWLTLFVYVQSSPVICHDLHVFDYMQSSSVTWYVLHVVEAVCLHTGWNQRVQVMSS